MQLVVLFLAVTSVLANNWATYPQVPKTASINGFADPIYDLLPSCAKQCVKVPTSNTPCPYWDTGCFCVMPQWSGMVAQCFASECSGKDVVSATSLAYSLCSRVGANLWLMPSSITAALTAAAGEYNEAPPSATNTEFNYLLSESYQSSSSSSGSSAASETGESAASNSGSSSSASSSGSSSTAASSSEASSSAASSSSGEANGMTVGLFTVVLGTLFSIIM